MKKAICSLLLFALVMTTLPYGCKRRGINKVTISPLVEEIRNVDVQWEELPVRAIVKPYTAKQDLSNVLNISKFTEIDTTDKEALSKNLFIIKQPDSVFEQPFNLYERNVEEGIPNFITTDSVLHVYHLIYDYIVKSIEKERMIDEVKKFTEGSFHKAIEVYNGTNEPRAKRAALKNVAYFGIAMRLLNIDLPGGIPLEANRIIDNDAKKVKSRWSSGTSEIFPYNIDYRKYIVKGQYSRDTEFANYFLTMMWYGSTPILFEQYDSSTKSYKMMDEQIAMAVIMAAQTLGDDTLRKQWEDIYRVSSQYLGKSSDINLYDMSDIVEEVYGEKLDFNKIYTDDKFQDVYEYTKQRYNMQLNRTIGGRIGLSDGEEKQQAQFRLMGQIYNIDADIYRNLTLLGDEENNGLRQMPAGLDIPAAFGNDRAYSISLGEIKEDTVLEKYTESILRIRKALSECNNPLEYSLGNSMLWIIRGLHKPYSPGYPTFMTNEKYRDKMLITTLGAISDSRHLSANLARPGESNINTLDRGEPIEIPGYVEPDADLYNRLEYMCCYIKSCLTSNSFKNPSIYKSLDSFTDLVIFLKQVSIKELENKPFSEEEEARLRNYDMELKTVTLNAVDSKGSTKQWETVPKVDRNMASVSDAYISENQAFQTATGNPDYIYAIVPYKGKLYLTRGSVYTYYEFVQPLSRKLRDNEWQNILGGDRKIEYEGWIKDIRG